MTTAVTVSASRKADRTAATRQNINDSRTLLRSFTSNFVKVNSRSSFMKKMPATMKTSNRITFRLTSTS